jgi:hypothetical protein
MYSDSTVQVIQMLVALLAFAGVVLWFDLREPKHKE